MWKCKISKFVGVLPHPVEHQHVIRNWILNLGIKAQSFWNTRHKVGGGYGIPAGKECHIVSQRNQFLSK